MLHLLVPIWAKIKESKMTKPPKNVDSKNRFISVYTPQFTTKYFFLEISTLYINFNKGFKMQTQLKVKRDLSHDNIHKIMHTK